MGTKEKTVPSIPQNALQLEDTFSKKIKDITGHKFFRCKKGMERVKKVAYIGPQDCSLRKVTKLVLKRGY